MLFECNFIFKGRALPTIGWQVSREVVCVVGARFALMGKGKHTLNLVAWHGSPPDDPPKSYIDMQQNKWADLSRSPIGQHKTTLSASRVANNQPPLGVIG